MKIEVTKADVPQKRKYKLGLNELLHFELRNYPEHWCIVYKRLRLDDEIPKLVVKDFIINVYQRCEP
jgi:hypothetical protein